MSWSRHSIVIFSIVWQSGNQSNDLNLDCGVAQNSMRTENDVLAINWLIAHYIFYVRSTIMHGIGLTVSCCMVSSCVVDVTRVRGGSTSGSRSNACSMRNMSSVSSLNFTCKKERKENIVPIRRLWLILFWMNWYELCTHYVTNYSILSLQKYYVDVNNQYWLSLPLITFLWMIESPLFSLVW